MSPRELWDSCVEDLAEHIWEHMPPPVLATSRRARWGELEANDLARLDTLREARQIAGFFTPLFLSRGPVSEPKRWVPRKGDRVIHSAYGPCEVRDVKGHMDHDCELPWQLLLHFDDGRQDPMWTSSWEPFVTPDWRRS